MVDLRNFNTVWCWSPAHVQIVQGAGFDSTQSLVSESQEFIHVVALPINAYSLGSDPLRQVSSAQNPRKSRTLTLFVKLNRSMRDGRKKEGGMSSAIPTAVVFLYRSISFVQIFEQFELCFQNRSSRNQLRIFQSFLVIMKFHDLPMLFKPEIPGTA